MTRPANLYRRFVASTRGVVAIEFAITLPMLLLLFLASIDAGNVIAIYMKVRSATFTLNAISNQYSTIHDTDAQTNLGATSVLLKPYSNTPVTVVISQVSISAAGAATISWSDALNTTARAQGSSVAIPAKLANSTAPNNMCAAYPCYVLLGEVTYRYTPMFGYFITGPITLAESLYVTPRNVRCILRPEQTVTSC